MGKREVATGKSLPAATGRGVSSVNSRVSLHACPDTRPPSSVAFSESAGGRGVEEEIAEIERLSLDDLRIRWRNLTGRSAPRYLSRSLLMRILAYRSQAQNFGDLDRCTARALARWGQPEGNQGQSDAVAQSAAGEPAADPSTTERRISEPLILKPGTLLTREWQGRMETVMVVTGGFAWNGRMFASLTAVALAITGTKWNGHRFFGVRPQDRMPVSSTEVGARPHGVKGDTVAGPTKRDSFRRPEDRKSSIGSRASGAVR